MSRFHIVPLQIVARVRGPVLWPLGFGQDSAFAQTRTAELDRIQAPAQALPGPEQRVALVIGNSNYQNAAHLANPDNDAQSVAELLNSAGFDVIAATDLTQNDLIKVVQNFSAKVAETRTEHGGDGLLRRPRRAGRGRELPDPGRRQGRHALRPRQQLAPPGRPDGDAGDDPEPAAHRHARLLPQQSIPLRRRRRTRTCDRRRADPLDRRLFDRAGHRGARRQQRPQPVHAGLPERWHASRTCRSSSCSSASASR